MELLVVAFLLGIGPLAMLLGVDSREDDPRGWWPGVPRRPAPGLPPGGRRAVAPAARLRRGTPGGLSCPAGMFETYVGTRDGVRRADAADPLGLTGERVSAIHAFRDRTGDVVILAGTYGNGLFRSADEGRTWAAVTDGMTAPAARTIGPDPLQPDVLLCGTEPARLFRSADGGVTWTELEGVRDIPEHEEWYLPYSPRAGAVRNVYAPPGGGELLAAVEVGGLMRSADGGDTWSIEQIGPNDDIHQVTGHPDGGGRLWSSLGWAALQSRERDADSPQLGGVGRSHDGGRTWDVLHTHYTRSVLVPPSRPQVVVAGPAAQVGQGGRIEISLNDGDSWMEMSMGIETPMPDMVELFVPAPDGSVYAVCSGGRLLRATPDRFRWSSAQADGAPDDVVSVSFVES
jgi:hypothetical protein